MMTRLLMTPVRLCAIVVLAVLLLSANLLVARAEAPLAVPTQSNPTVYLSSSSFSFDESISATVFVHLNFPHGQTVTVDYATSDGTALAGSDYTATSGTLTFAPGETRKAISLSILGDAQGEESETFSLSLSNPVGAQMNGTATATVTIYRNNLLNIESDRFYYYEHDGSVQFSVVVINHVSHTITVDYATAAGTATAGSDFIATSGTLTFAPGESVKTISVPLIADGLDEGYENFSLVLSNPTNAALSFPSSYNVWISSYPKLSFTYSSYEVLENVGSVPVVVTMSSSAPFPVTVSYATADGTATAGSDYTAANGTLTFAPGEESKIINVPIVNDGLDEPVETLSMSLSSPTMAVLDSPSTTTLRIRSGPKIRFVSSTYSVTESAGRVDVVVEVVPPFNQWVSFDYTTSAGTATAGSDYTPQSVRVVLSPGVATTTISIPIINDGLDEPDETFHVIITAASNALVASPSSTTVTIDTYEKISFEANAYSAIEGSAVLIGVQLSGPASQSVTVSYATGGGTATAGSDYTPQSGTLTFLPGETSKTISVPTLEEHLGEPAETIGVSLSSPSNAILGSPAVATITLEASDRLSFSTDRYYVHESGGSIAVTVELNGPSRQTVTVNYASGDGIGAVAGSDYTAVNGTLTFAPGETSKTIAVPIREDGQGEPNETFNLQLSGPMRSGFGSHTGTVVTIMSNDRLTFSATNYYVGEGGGAIVITVSLNAPSNNSVTVGYATSNGTAAAGSDYTAVNGTLTFAPGETSKTFSVSIFDDALDEGNQTIKLALSGGTAADLGTPSSATITIQDND